MTQQEARWSSSSFMMYVRDNTEDPQWVPTVLTCKKEARGGQEKEPCRDSEGRKMPTTLL